MSREYWTDGQVRRALGLEGSEDGPAYGAISTDTRSLAPGDLFVALKGAAFDGHRFLDAAASAGARGAVVSDPEIEAPAGLVLYPVEDTLLALGRLAAHRRNSLQARFIGVVGSNGKTTTKELIRAVLDSRYRTTATQGNLNNQIGVPLTLLGVPDDSEVVVVEMGTDRPGEIAALTTIVRPDYVVITSIGEEHLELLVDMEGVLQEEISILEGLDRGKAFVAEEPEILPRRARELLGRGRVRIAGLSESADLRPDGGERGIRVFDDGSTLWQWRGYQVRLPIPGRFQVRNALLALGVALELGVPAEDAVRSLGRVQLPRLRGEWARYGQLRVLADCYNSNPPSLAGAIDLLTSLPGPTRRVAVLGTMRELGETSDQLHAAAADRIAKKQGQGLDLVVATGAFAVAFEPYQRRLGDRLILAEDPLDAYAETVGSLRGAETILLKASRGEQLERWLPLLERDFGESEGERDEG